MMTKVATSISWEGMTIKDKLGSGSFGTVYRVLLNGKEYAMKKMTVPQSQEEQKALLRKLGNEQSVKEYCRDVAQDLLHEVSVLQNLKEEPNIVSVLDCRSQETQSGYEIAFLMEQLEPFPVYEKTHRLEEADVLSIGLDLCTALEACERKGILHRDLKPDNILVTKDGRFQICDFGVARNLEKTRVTASVQGTFSFMAPEVYYGKKYDHRADLYSLGLILYRLMNKGWEPFVPADANMLRYKDVEAALNRRMSGEAIPAPADASPEFSEILLRACAYYPEKRYASATDMKKDLFLLQEGKYKRKGIEEIGKRTARDYLRVALAAAGILTAVFVLCKAALFIYRDRFVNLCDPRIQAILAEEYGLVTGPRLDGNGVLHIERNEDLYCTYEGEYPWMEQKDLIKKIVFGENVTGHELDPEVINRGKDRPYTVYGSRASVIPGLENVKVDVYAFVGNFQQCKNLKEVVIQGDSFCFAPFISFAGCENLEVIDCKPGAKVSEMRTELFEDTAWYRKEGCRMLGSVLFRYNGSKEIVDDIPAYTTQIAEAAFSGNEQVSEIFLPDGLQEIGTRAFRDCSRLKTVHISEGVEVIGVRAFENCSSLESLAIPRSVKIMEGAFYGCGSLKNLTVAAENPYYSFTAGALYNKAQTDLLWVSPVVEGTFVIPASVTNLSPYALVDCSLLSEIVFSEQEELSGQTSELFGKVPNLTKIVLSESNPLFSLEGELLCSKDGEEVFLCLRGAAGEVVIPEGVRVIGSNAFYGCSGVTRVEIPDSVMIVNPGAFENCTSLENIALPGSLRVIPDRVFSGCTRLTDIDYAGTKEEWDYVTKRPGLGLEDGKVTMHFSERGNS